MSSKRSRRSKKPSKGAAALERMRRERAGEDISEEDSEDDAVYDVVDETQYRELVRNRRKQENFVVDDDGTGYYDDGEEHLFEQEDGGAPKAKKSKHPTFRNQSDSGKKKQGGALSRAAMEKAREAHREKLSAGSAGSRNIGAMFLGIKNKKSTKHNKKNSSSSSSSSSLSSSNTNNKKTGNTTSNGPTEDFDLDSMLDDLVEGPQDSESLASMSHVALKTPAVTATGMKKKRKVGDVLYGDRLVDSPSGTTSKKKVARTSNDLDVDISNSSSNKTNTTAKVQQDTTMGPPETSDFSNGDFGNDDDGDVTMGGTDATSTNSATSSTSTQVDKGKVAVPAPVTKRSRFIEAQRKRIEEKKQKAATQKAAAAARIQAAQDATARAMEKQNANVRTESGKGGWWAQNAGSSDASSSSSSSPSSTAPTGPSAADMVPQCMETAKDEDGDEYECLRMFFLDAYERHDRIYMFGKVWVPSKGLKVTNPGEGKGSFQSICVQITGNERQLFFLPRHWNNADKLDKVALYNEVKTLLQNGPLAGKRDAFRCKFVDRNYAFELQGVPREVTSYMKCKYSAKHGMLDNGIEGKHFSKCFGARTNCLENFLIKRRIMGPCWIEIREPKKGANASWCRVEASIDDPKLVSICSGSRNLDAPPVVVMSLDIKTRVNKQQKHEVVMISALVHKDVLTDKPTPNEMHRSKIGHFTVARSFAGPGLPGHISEQTRKELAEGRKKGTVNLKILGSSERGLLQFVMGQLSAYDPDCIVGHNIHGHSMDVLMHRMSELRVSNWSRIGRLNLATFPRAYQRGKAANTRNFDRLAIGRLVVDTYSTAKELVRSESVYTLKAMAKKYCNAERLEILPLDVPNYFGTTKSLLHLQHHTENGAFLSLQLMFRLEMLPLTKQLTNLGGNLWSKTLSGGRAERIEYLLLHEFHRRKYIVPDKIYKKKGNGKRGKSKYAGGLVLEPKKGLYDKYVLLLDFNSLYPSIIQEYNICFTTVHRQLEGQENVDTSYGTTEQEQKAAGGDGMSNFVVPELPNAAEFTDSSGTRVWAVLPTLLKTLISRRSVVKRQLKKEEDPIKKRLLHNKQLALKLTANSMYGCLGFKNSRFYAAPIAALVTQTGREILQNTCDMTNGMGYEVIYGDTDSIMVYTNSTDLKQVQEIGKQVKKEVNKLYRLLEIEIDGVYKTMLLLKKKKYAAVMVKDKPDGSYVLETETKGLDLVRRDWCQLSKDIGLRCLEKILSGTETEEVVVSIHEDCAEVARSMRAGEVELSKFTITKGLSKAPKDYPNAKNMPHVMVALGMVKNGRPVNVGDHIPYVICNEAHAGTVETSSQSAATRAYHPDAVTAAREAFERQQSTTTSSSTSSTSSSSNDGTTVATKKPALTIDIEWYLSQQILPPTERLCDPIEGTSRHIIAEHLGLDAQKYAMSSSSGMNLDEDLIKYTPSTQMPDKQRYKHCRPLSITCPSCAKTSSFTGVLNFVASESSALVEANSGMICKSCNKHEFTLAHMTNMLDMSIRSMTLEYYAGWSECTESTCGNKTRQCSCLGGVCVMPNCGSNTNESFSAGALYTQLKYYESLFDLEKWGEQLKEKLGMTNMKSYLGTEQHQNFQALKERVTAHLATSDYQWIRPQMWSTVFGGAKTGNKRVMA